MVNQVRKRKMDYSLNSHAKINLFLDVLSKLPGGYHEILTIFSEIDLHDKIKYFLTNKPEIKIMSNVGELNNNNNLIYKIAVYLKDRYSVNKGVSVELEKNIPISAGLGGGSSNAASTIKALSYLWDLNLSWEEMHEIASMFGSDINFFLIGGTAKGTNRGDIITPLDDIELDNILLINPNLPISSKEAYQAVKIEQSKQNWQNLLSTHSTDYCFNKLETGIIQLYPVIGELIDELYLSGAKKAMMSGSGSTVIGFYDNQNKCKNAQMTFQEKGYWSYITSTRRRLKE